ncbi:tetratricopeptide repeat protein [Pseudoxanthomonas sp. USHLN014]|uniref:tetratricopeptide repeat protein n=1 Tax=Pseudoxanthomonas sp. USHLN014 TaxID=3081297 RepID=UPI00301D3AEA
MDATFIKNLALQGDAGAMLAYGVLAVAGKTEKGLAEAAAWCEAAGDHGISFGYLMASELITPSADNPHAQSSVPLLRKAAQTGAVVAMYNLGLALARDGSLKEAIHWIREAALKFHSAAACHMGELVEEGKATLEEAAPYTALEWFEFAARLGDSHAAFRLGEAYGEGRNVAKDECLSKHWYETSAALGSSMAHRMLAFSYAMGQDGFPFNPSLAEFHEHRAEQLSQLDDLHRKVRMRWIENLREGDDPIKPLDF